MKDPPGKKKLGKITGKQGRSIEMFETTIVLQRGVEARAGGETLLAVSVVKEDHLQ